MQRSNAFREPSEASLSHLSEIEDPDLDILISSLVLDNDVSRLEEDQDHEDGPRPISRSGSFGSQVDSLCTSDDSDPNKSTKELKGLSSNQELTSITRNDTEYPGSRVGSFNSQVDSSFKSDPSQTPDLMKNEIDIDLKSLRAKAIHELSMRPKSGEIYKEITCNSESFIERIEYMLKKEESFTIEEAIMIIDLGHLLDLLNEPKDENTLLPDKIANDAVFSILQAEKLIKKGHNLLDQSKSILQLAMLRLDTS